MRKVWLMGVLALGACASLSGPLPPKAVLSIGAACSAIGRAEARMVPHVARLDAAARASIRTLNAAARPYCDPRGADGRPLELPPKLPAPGELLELVTQVTALANILEARP
jgi:hypothetical protein